MDKYTLAQQLRKRQYAQGLLSKHVIDAVSDDDIIDSYITCSCCGEMQVTPLQLAAAITYDILEMRVHHLIAPPLLLG